MSAIGNNTLINAYIGSNNIKKLYVGNNLIFNNLLFPVLSNFTIEDAQPTRVYFDSSKIITATTVTGFVIQGKTISSVTIAAGLTTGHYFTMSAAFNFWDNDNINYSGGSDIADLDTNGVYDFTLSYTTNNIAEPTISPSNYRYMATAADGGSDSNNGLTTGTPWLTLKYSVGQLPSGGGYKIWVKTGTYTGENIVDGDIDPGTESAPYVIEGYKTTIGDITSNYYTYTPLTTPDALDNTEMPIFDGGDRTTGQFFHQSNDAYWIKRNIQVTGYKEGFRSTSTNGQIVDNCNLKDIGSTTVNNGLGIYYLSSDALAHRSRVLNCNLVDITAVAVRLGGDNCLIDNTNVYCRTGSDNNEVTDYYFSMEGQYGTVRNCLAYKDTNSGLGHNGHGFSAKTNNNASPVHYNLFENCTAIGILGSFQARHANCKFNVWKNSEAHANISNRKSGSTDSYTCGIDFVTGGDQNVFENLYIHDCDEAIRFNKNAEADSDINIQTNALIKNCVIDNVKRVILANSVTAGTSAPSGNKLANCTIRNADFFYWQFTGTGSIVFGLNKIENCIIDDVTGLWDTTADPNPPNGAAENPVGWTYDRDNIYNSWDTTIGTNSINVNPTYGTFPTPTNASLKAGKAIDNVFYDKEEEERTNTDFTVTIGAISI